MLLCALSLAGCSRAAGPGDANKFGLPNLAHPGSASYQRTRAQYFDPYPEPQVGPNIDSARPRDFQQPLPEVERARRIEPRASARGAVPREIVPPASLSYPPSASPPSIYTPPGAG